MTLDELIAKLQLIRKNDPDAGKRDIAPVWTYNPYRATLLKNGKTFAIVTPDGKNELDAGTVDELLKALNK